MRPDGHAHFHRHTRADGDRTAGERGDIPPDLIARLDQTKVDMHREYAALSANGSLVVVEDTTHLIQNDQPQAVIDAILRALEMARRSSQ